MRWQNKLNKTEMNHFRYATHGEMTLRAFKESREGQAKLAASSRYPNSEVCFKCKSIAVKLGLEKFGGDNG